MVVSAIVIAVKFLVPPTPTVRLEAYVYYANGSKPIIYMARH